MKPSRFESKTVWALGALALAAIGGLLYLGIAHRTRAPGGTAPTIAVQRLSTQKRVTSAALSPDGSRLVFASPESKGESLWMTELGPPNASKAAAATSLVKLREAGDGVSEYERLAFSPDGQFLYFVSHDKAPRNKAPVGELYRMPSNGGPPGRIAEGLTGSVTFEPGGKRLAFVRLDHDRWASSLIVANADGSEEHALAVRTRPRYFSDEACAWSPDGKSIVCGAGESEWYNERAFQLVEVRVADGAEQPISADAWSFLGSMAWLPGGQKLVLAGSKNFDRQGLMHIWEVEYPSGVPTMLTTGPNNYDGLSLNAAGTNLVAIETATRSSLWAAADSNPDGAAQISSGSYDGVFGMAWTPDGQLLYTSNPSGPSELWSMSPDGSGRRQLDGRSPSAVEQAVTRDGRFILYRSQNRIWRMNPDGGGKVPLTSGALDVHPSSSADSRWVMYASFAEWSPVIGGRPTLWKVPIEGGTPVQITTKTASYPEASPDGSRIACMVFLGVDPNWSPMKIGMAPWDRMQPIQLLDLPPGGDGPVHWQPDGQAITYVRSGDSADNIWSQPVNGGAPAQITHFRDGRIFQFAWSKTGRLAVARGNSSREVVFLSGFR